MHAWGVRSVTPVMRDRVSVAGPNVTVITIAGPVPQACRARYPLRLTFACRPAKATGSPTTSALERFALWTAGWAPSSRSNLALGDRRFPDADDMRRLLASGHACLGRRGRALHGGSDS